MSHPYADSIYAHERVGWDLNCEPDPAVWPEIEDGDVSKCAHCDNEYEHEAGNPKPCIERIAMALEEARGSAPEEMPDDAPPSPDALPSTPRAVVVAKGPDGFEGSCWDIPTNLLARAPARPADQRVKRAPAPAGNAPTLTIVDGRTRTERTPADLADRVAAYIGATSEEAPPPHHTDWLRESVQTAPPWTLPEGWTPPGQGEPTVRWRNVRITPSTADELRVVTSALADPFGVDAFLDCGWATQNDGLAAIVSTIFEGPSGTLPLEAELPRRSCLHVYTRDEVIAALNGRGARGRACGW